MAIKIIITSIVIVFFVVLVFFITKKKNMDKDDEVITEGMKLTSPEFVDNQSIPSKYTCDGENINPSLFIEKVPQNAKSLAIIVDDPDAPSGDFVHWLVWNIDPDTKEIKSGHLPINTVEGTTSFGNIGYGGPCPPSGTHRYYFKLYALNIDLDLPSSARKADLKKIIDGHILDKAQLMGIYKGV